MVCLIALSIELDAAESLFMQIIEMFGMYNAHTLSFSIINSLLIP